MNLERILTIILSPHISEKSSKATGDYPQYAFRVLPNATKPEIKVAIQDLFKVKVKSVRVCNVKSKAARYGKTLGKHQGWKKAYVLLEKGEEINADKIES